MQLTQRDLIDEIQDVAIAAAGGSHSPEFLSGAKSFAAKLLSIELVGSNFEERRAIIDDACTVAILKAYPARAADETWLPPASGQGVYRFPDGAAIQPVVIPGSSLTGKFVAQWADGTPLRNEDGTKSFFNTAHEAAVALRFGGEGPAGPVPGAPNGFSHPMKAS